MSIKGRLSIIVYFVGFAIFVNRVLTPNHPEPLIYPLNSLTSFLDTVENFYVLEAVTTHVI